jgi:hypothetical protein
VIGENDKAAKLILIIRDLLHSPKFKQEHRTSPEFGTNDHKINFVTTILLILRKSVRSAQPVLNEFFKDLGNGVLVTNSAFTQARGHLRYQAFTTLNQNNVNVFYSDKKYLTFEGFRVLSVDSSKFICLMHQKFIENLEQSNLPMVKLLKLWVNMVMGLHQSCMMYLIKL